MDKFVKGVLKFYQQFFVENKTLIDELAAGQITRSAKLAEIYTVASEKS